VCHPKSGNAQDLRCLVDAHTGARPASRGGRGGLSRSRAGSDYCEQSSTILTKVAIYAAPLGFITNLAFGVAAVTPIGVESYYAVKAIALEDNALIDTYATIE